MSNKYLDFALKEIVNHEVNDVLDKIRAEIEQFVSVSISDVEVMPKSDVLQIIDKYKAESEDK